MSLLDRMRFPATPEEMEHLLQIELFVKDAQGFTNAGIGGYIIVTLEFWKEQQLQRDRIMYGYSVIEASTGQRVDPRSIKPS